ncbi:MAG TPA: glycosyltransferase family 87 protein [Xanthobacteraceae bacterium]|nr:glycosyltransferase family 87 protein [Xanthobacteraceae bacterium]
MRDQTTLPVLGDEALLRRVAHVWIALAAAFCAFDLWRKTGVGLTDGEGRPIGDDFVNYFSGAWLALHQRASEIYHWPAYHAFQEALVGASVSPNYNYSYPPVMIALAVPFALLPYVPAFALWLVGGWYAFFSALRLATPNALLLALATPAVFINTYCGQNGVWTAAFLGGGLCLLERRPVIAGVLFGLQAYKPHLALMIPVALLAGRQWRAIAAAAATVGALVAASLALAGWDIWRDYVAFLPMLRLITLEVADGMWHRHASVFMVVNQMGAGVTAAYAVQAAVGLGSALLVALAWAKRAPEPLRNALTLIGALLATPYLQDYDLVLGAFIVAWVMNTEGAARPDVQIACALILLLPLVMAPLAKLTGVAFGPLFIIPALVVTARMIFGAPAPRVAQLSASRP